MLHYLNRFSWLSAAPLLLASQLAFAAPAYVVDEANSNVNFSVTKVQYVIEPAEFKKVSGQVSKDGEVEIEIDINSVYSDNGIRDKRLVDLFFQTEMFPSATISAEVEPEWLTLKAPKRVEIPAILEWFDNSAEINLDALIVPTKDGMVITSMSPNIIEAKKFGVPVDHLEALRKVCNNISIADKAAVNFVLTLKKP